MSYVSVASVSMDEYLVSDSVFRTFFKFLTANDLSYTTFTLRLSQSVLTS